VLTPAVVTSPSSKATSQEQLSALVVSNTGVGSSVLKTSKVFSETKEVHAMQPLNSVFIQELSFQDVTTSTHPVRHFNTQSPSLETKTFSPSSLSVETPSADIRSVSPGRVRTSSQLTQNSEKTIRPTASKTPSPRRERSVSPRERVSSLSRRTWGEGGRTAPFVQPTPWRSKGYSNAPDRAVSPPRKTMSTSSSRTPAVKVSGSSGRNPKVKGATLRSPVTF
jgi:hypothetical protein